MSGYRGLRVGTCSSRCLLRGVCVYIYIYTYLNTTQHSSVQYNATKQHYATTQCNTVQDNGRLQYKASRCDAMRCDAMRCDAIQRNAMHHTTIPYNSRVGLLPTPRCCVGQPGRSRPGLRPAEPTSPLFHGAKELSSGSSPGFGANLYMLRLHM